jgi:hypothetical protein
VYSVTRMQILPMLFLFQFLNVTQFHGTDVQKKCTVFCPLMFTKFTNAGGNYDDKQACYTEIHSLLNLVCICFSFLSKPFVSLLIGCWPYNCMLGICFHIYVMIEVYVTSNCYCKQKIVIGIDFII